MALRARRLEGIDVVVVTHAHPDHWGGLPGLASEFSIREIWLPDPREREDEGRLFELARVLSSRGVWVRRLSAICGRVDLSFGEAQLRILSPCGTESESWSANERSTVIEMEYAQRRYLFTGDIEAVAERSLLERHPDLRADILKVAHHGSNTSSGAAFLMAVQPRVAIIPCGLANRFGHPHGEVLDRLGNIRSRILRTDQSASLILEQRGADLYLNH